MGIVKKWNMKLWGQKCYHYSTEEVHSYRMEAFGLLSGLMHLRTGTIEWHMDSKSVIDTYKKCHRLTNAEWTTQRDKDVWEALIIEKNTGQVE